MELLVAATLAIVIYCGYLTAKDIARDLQLEGVLLTLAGWRKHAAKKMYNIDRLYRSWPLDDTLTLLPRRALVPVRVRNEPPEPASFRPYPR